MKYWPPCLRDCGREKISSTLRKLKKLNFEDRKDGYVVSVAIALLIASILLISFYAYLWPQQIGHMSLSLLDSQRKTENYPSYLVNGVNSTFSVYVKVENHMTDDMDTKVLVRVTQEIITEVPLYSVNQTETYLNSIPEGQSAENIATITLNEPGNYSIIFELWIKGPTDDEFGFSKNYCVLNVQVV